MRERWWGHGGSDEAARGAWAIAGVLALASSVGCSATIESRSADDASSGVPPRDAAVDLSLGDTSLDASPHADVATGSALDGPTFDAARTTARLDRTVELAPVAEPGLTAPRPVVPSSLADVSLRRPSLRWRLPVGADGAVVELCSDRNCSDRIESLRVVGAAARPTADLPARSVVFWRVRALRQNMDVSPWGPTWLFHVPARDNSGGLDASGAPHLDVNGDGFDDIVVGAIWDGYGGSAYVFHGGRDGVSPEPARIYHGTMDAVFGYAVANAGDVNGDGFADIIIGAENQYAPSLGFVGAAHLYLGGPDGAAAEPARVVLGNTAYGEFGGAVSGAGDVNGDGYADVIIGALGVRFSEYERHGAAFVFHGGASGLAAAPAIVLRGDPTGGNFGHAVASAGDIDGDGFSDVVVGDDYSRDSPDRRHGIAYVYRGGSSGVDPVAARTLRGSTSEPWSDDDFGFSISGAGDINNDGFSDVVVGAHGERGLVGAAYVFNGGRAALEETTRRAIPGDFRGDYFGASLSRAGDINGDGFDDIVVGAFETNHGGLVECGSVYTFHGGIDGVVTPAATMIDGTTHRNWLGRVVAAAGDVNGDGFDDVVVGSYYASTVYVFHGGSAGLTRVPARVLLGFGRSPYGTVSRFGCSVARLDATDAPRRRSSLTPAARAVPSRVTPPRAS